MVVLVEDNEQVEREDGFPCGMCNPYDVDERRPVPERPEAAYQGLIAAGEGLAAVKGNGLELRRGLQLELVLRVGGVALDVEDDVYEPGLVLFWEVEEICFV